MPGGVVSRWNRESYEAYENSPEGRAKTASWAREVLFDLADEA